MSTAPKLVSKTEFKIEKGVPLPIPASAESARKYPFPDMGVGDSIFIPGQTAGSSDGNAKAATAARSYAKVHGITFKCRTVEGGVRIWRTA